MAVAYVRTTYACFITQGVIISGMKKNETSACGVYTLCFPLIFPVN